MTHTFASLFRRLVRGLAVLALAAVSLPVLAGNTYFYALTSNDKIGKGTVGSGLDDNWFTLSPGAAPIGITTDNTNLYWANAGSGTLSRVDLAAVKGTGDYTWVTVDGARNLAFSPNLATLWVGCPGTGKIVKVDKGTGAVTDMLIGMGATYAPDRGLAVDGNYLYWGNSVTNTFYRCPIPATTKDISLGEITPETIAVASGLDATPNTVLGTITVNQSSIILSTSLDTGGNGKIFTKALDNTGGVTTRVTGLTYPDAFWASDTELFYPSGQTIYRVPYTDWTTPVLVDTIVDASEGPGGITKTGVSATVVTLTSFAAQAANGKVNVAWTTGSEVNAAGFNLHRAASVDGPYAKVNAALIPATGTNAAGASYAWTDAAVAAGTTYFYKLEDVDTKGVCTFHGPVSALAATSAIASFQATPASIFAGGGSFLSWTLNGATALLDGTAVTGTSQWVAPAATKTFTLAAGADSAVTTVTVKAFGMEDIAGLSKAWGHRKGEAAYDPSYDLNGDGIVDDADVALCFKGL